MASIRRRRRLTQCKMTGGRLERPSQPVSRVLSRAIIHLRPASPRTCSGLPESSASSTMGFLFGLAPGGVYLAADCYQPRGALLPHHFTLTRRLSGGMLSVALAVGSRPPGVTWRPALWSPDFPPPASRDANGDCPADSNSQPNEFLPPTQNTANPQSGCPLLSTSLPPLLSQNDSGDLHCVSRRRLARGLAGVPDMDVGAEAYRDVFTASAKPRASRRRRTEATIKNMLKSGK